MSLENKLREELSNGDYRNEDEDEYVKMVKADNKKSLAIKIGIGALYVSLLLGSLFIV